MEKYGNAASEEALPRELLLGQSEKEIEYDRAGRIIRGQEAALPKSKYKEDVHINNHTTVWGSWWKDHQWGYKCCKQTICNSYCTGSAGIEAAKAATELLKTNMAHKEATDDKPVLHEEKQLATWGTEVPYDLVLDKRLLAKALKKVTAEDMEAYRMKKIHHDDPMKDFRH
ncbi:pre-mRNA-splicing factor [Musa troglodytarum]|uniref:Pre-mRNA-splicing factor SLU7 n=1 Tax=Musa troglodytarum TaxID=320322 RepID=A0A9E7K489_9LILI|nr:pre-mRNA-splicing factor [Musa troglodytarum]